MTSRQLLSRSKVRLMQGVLPDRACDGLTGFRRIQRSSHIWMATIKPSQRITCICVHGQVPV